MSQAKEKLREVLTAIVEEQYPQATDVKVKPFSSEGANYSSALFQVTIITPEENIEVFAKVCDMGDILNVKTSSKIVFESEKYVYSSLSNAYEKLQDEKGIADDRYVFPKYYKSNATDGQKIVIMENLTAKGYSCHDRFEVINWKYASKCVETLAKYHALSFALSKYDPEEFKKAGQSFQTLTLQPAGWDGLIDGAMAAVDEEDREKLANLFEGSVGWKCWKRFKDFCDPLKTPVIIHGDYRASNLLHKEVNRELHVIPVDYQMARIGCPAADLLYFILMGSDQQFRQQHFHQLLDHYYEKLARAMRRLGVEPEEAYSREEFDSDIKEKVPLAVCVAAMILPFITVDPENAPVFKDNKRVPRPSVLFEERFRRIMQDFKQWGFI